MNVRTISDLKNIRGKRVFLRSDFNVDITAQGRVQDDLRMVRALPTYKWLIARGAKIIVATHLGRPAGKKVKALQTDPIAKHLATLLKRKVIKVNDSVGPKVKAAVEEMKDGEILFLENTRFHKEEQGHDAKFAKKYASFADIFVNDAFGSLHDDDASVAGIARFLPTYAGLLVEQELKNIDRLIKKPQHPFVFVIGGAKLSTKIKLIRKLTGLADHVLVGGALASSFFAAAGAKVGKSLTDPDSFTEAQLAMRRADRNPGHMILPNDVIVAQNLSGKGKRIATPETVQKNEAIFDIGPQTRALYAAIIQRAKTVIFNGAMGVFEKKPFEAGTKEIFATIADARAHTLAGGGETIVALDQYKLSKKINFISTGGGALLSYIEGAPMPGLKGIPKK